MRHVRCVKIATFRPQTVSDANTTIRQLSQHIEQPLPVVIWNGCYASAERMVGNLYGFTQTLRRNNTNGIWYAFRLWFMKGPTRVWRDDGL